MESVYNLIWIDLDFSKCFWLNANHIGTFLEKWNSYSQFLKPSQILVNLQTNHSSREANCLLIWNVIVYIDWFCGTMVSVIYLTTDWLTASLFSWIITNLLLECGYSWLFNLLLHFMLYILWCVLTGRFWSMYRLL